MNNNDSSNVNKIDDNEPAYHRQQPGWYTNPEHSMDHTPACIQERLSWSLELFPWTRYTQEMCHDQLYHHSFYRKIIDLYYSTPRSISASYWRIMLRTGSQVINEIK